MVSTSRNTNLPLRFALACLAFVLCSGLAAACPTCKEALAGDPHAVRVAAGYYYSILFMMAMPFVLIGSFGSYAYFSVRRARRQGEATAELR